MFLSEKQAEAKLAELRRRRDALDRTIADHSLYLELGRRLQPASTFTASSLPDSDDPSMRPRRYDEAASGIDRREFDQAESPDRPADRTGVQAKAVPEAEPDDGRRRGRALVAAAADVLRAAKRPLHAREILDGLTLRGLAIPGSDPVAALNTRLWKRSGPSGIFRRLGDATYVLGTDVLEDPGSA